MIAEYDQIMNAFKMIGKKMKRKLKFRLEINFAFV